MSTPPAAGPDVSLPPPEGGVHGKTVPFLPPDADDEKRRRTPLRRRIRFQGPADVAESSCSWSARTVDRRPKRSRLAANLIEIFHAIRVKGRETHILGAFFRSPDPRLGLETVSAARSYGDI